MLGKLRLLADRSGSTLVEFSLLGVPFLVMVFAMVEISANAFLSQQVDEVVTRSARFVQTGGVHEGQLSASAFKTEACKSIVAMMDCTKLTVSVMRVDASFLEMMDGSTNEDGVWQGRVIRPDERPGGPGYCVGEPGDYLVIQAVYPSMDLLPFVPVLAPGNGAVTHASTVIRNEPFVGAASVPGQNCP